MLQERWPANMNLNAQVERIDATTVVVTLTGRMTLGMRLHEVEATINKIAWDGTHKLVLELSGVEYADSASLGLLMLLYGRMKTVGGQLRLVAPRKQLLDIFKLTCTDSILTIDPDLPAALAPQS
ncbi:MAG: STAS domain-containing protein [Acidobacteriaceae bacterium]